MGLFSTTYHRHTTNTVNVPYEKTVHEHRVPTDDSIRIYDEILEKTKDRDLLLMVIEKISKSIALEMIQNVGTKQIGLKENYNFN